MKKRLTAMINIINFIQSVDQVVPGFASYETLLYSPELKFYSNKIRMDTSFSTNVRGLHCLGDSSGWTRGLMMASAMELIRRYATIEQIYSELETIDVKEGVRKKLSEGRDSAFLSYELATISREAPVDFAPEDGLWSLTPNSAMCLGVTDIKPPVFKKGWTKTAKRIQEEIEELINELCEEDE